jgi:predicted ArsR family transcriptional regulator
MADDSKDRILHLLKTRGAATATGLARKLSLTAAAVRQHLAALEQEGLVTFSEQRGGVGRPSRHWQLTSDADGRFPDGHAELALEMVDAVRAAFGDAGMDRLVAERTRAQRGRYQELLPPADSPLAKRVAALAKLRRDEGYLAEWSRRADGSFLLIENHCPVCAVAQVCQGLCAGELELFADVLGDAAEVERTEHLMAGDRRCAYRITPRG